MTSPPAGPANVPGTMACFVDNAFPRASIDYLNRLAEDSASEAKAGSIVNAAATGSGLETIRRSEVFWLKRTPESQPIVDQIADLVRQTNSQVYRYELEQFESLQIATYRSENEGFYGWHVDVGPGRLSRRKLSLILPLTDPCEYEGGEFQAFCDVEPVTVPLPLGCVVAFPSFMLHRVTPVTKGVRRSLAVWACGRPFS